MRVALHTTFTASRKEPLVTMMDRVHQAFLDAGLGEPAIRFSFAEGGVTTKISCVDRALKRHPELEKFVMAVPAIGGGTQAQASLPAIVPGAPGAVFQFPERRAIANGKKSPAPGEDLPYATLQSLASGVPRSFPFGQVSLHFSTPEFGNTPSTPAKPGEQAAGILITDSWWVNGRNRTLSAITVVDAPTVGKKLPPPPAAVGAVLAALGKARKTMQVPIAEPSASEPVVPVRLPSGVAVASPDPAAAVAARKIVADYRARMKEIVEQAALPHDLPSMAEALQNHVLGQTTGPKKPVLERSFKPMGYTCKGESATFTLRRRTPANLTLELSVDVGTWSRSVTPIFFVRGMGFKASLFLPVTANGLPTGNYPIGDGDRWQKIVENLAALVAELERTFVPEIEAATGPSPEWYQPES
jgi:hypothetical protein